MILDFPVSLKEIARLGRDFPWPRPAGCPVCGHDRLWGHGFVMAFFDGFVEGIRLRRWRCPECGGVHRARPAGYWPRFQASTARIFDSLSGRIKTGFWPTGLSRSRQGHWLRGLMRQAAAYLGLGFLDRLLESFDRLLLMGRIPVGRSV